MGEITLAVANLGFGYSYCRDASLQNLSAAQKPKSRGEAINVNSELLAKDTVIYQSCKEAILDIPAQISPQMM